MTWTIKSEKEFQNIFFYICENLNIQSHGIAYTKSNKGQELSYHFSNPSLHTTLKTMRNLFKMCKEEEPELLNALDLNVYTPYRWFRLPNQTLNSKPFLHHIVKGEMKDFILSHIDKDISDALTINNNDKQMDEVINSTSPEYKIRVKKIFNYDPAIQYKIKDEEIIELLDQLPSKYLDDYDKWSIITNMLKCMDKR